MPRAYAALWGQDPDATHLIAYILGRADIAVTPVDSAATLLAADRQGDVAFLVIDCSVGGDALDRCLLVITHTARPIHLCHPRQEFVDDLAPLAHGPLLWLPPAWTGIFLLDKARTLLVLAETESDTAPHPVPNDVRLPDLSDDEVAVLQGLAAGLTQVEIAVKEHRSTAKVERMIATLKGKFHVTSTNALCAQAARFGLIQS